MIMLLFVLTRADVHRIPRNVCVRASPPMSIASRLELTTLLILFSRFICTRTSIPTFIRRTFPYRTCQWSALRFSGSFNGLPLETTYMCSISAAILPFHLSVRVLVVP